MQQNIFKKRIFTSFAQQQGAVGDEPDWVDLLLVLFLLDQDVSADVDHDRGKSHRQGDAEQRPAHPRKEVETVGLLDADQQADVHGQVQGSVSQAKTYFQLKCL